MEPLPAYGLANTVTGFATLFSGCMCLALTWLTQPQPARWRLAYWTIVATGVLTVTLHGFGETMEGFGPRWLWAFLDTGSNIVVAWAIAIAALGDFHPPRVRRWATPLLTSAMLVGVGWHLIDRLPEGERSYLVPIGDFGGFYPGERWLIGLSWVVVALFFLNRARIPPSARPLLSLVVGLFFIGMLLATARNDTILYPFFSLHALWHLVGAFGFIALWAMNFVRFTEAAQSRREDEEPSETRSAGALP